MGRKKDITFKYIKCMKILKGFLQLRISNNIEIEIVFIRNVPYVGLFFCPFQYLLKYTILSQKDSNLKYLKIRRRKELTVPLSHNNR